MKVNKAIYLNFNLSTQATANINVNFPVKSIHVKSSVYNATTAITPGDELYFTLTSDLVNWEPMAHLYNSTTYSASQYTDISFVPYKPITINGTYTFKLIDPFGVEDIAPVSSDWVNLILEFNGEGTPIH